MTFDWVGGFSVPQKVITYGWTILNKYDKLFWALYNKFNQILIPLNLCCGYTFISNWKCNY